MKLSPDETIFYQYGFITINLTLVTTWVLMLVIVIGSGLITHNLKSEIHISHWQNILEIIVLTIKNQIQEIGIKNPEHYIGFIGSLFLFIGFSNLCIIFPYYEPPTGSLSTTAALSICVFLAVPFYGIEKNGVLGYLKTYLEPTFVVLPFHLISELTRTLALAIRLFGNIMSGGLIIVILLSVSPLLFPVLMNALGLITGMAQAYIFSILATVYIAAAIKHSSKQDEQNK